MRLAENELPNGLSRELERLASSSEGEARDAALAIERALDATLRPLVGMRAAFSLEDEDEGEIFQFPTLLMQQEEILRLAIASAVGPYQAAKIRKRAAAQRPVYVCRGNPLTGPDAQFEKHGPRGCGVVFTDRQWRLSRQGPPDAFGGRQVVALGPRCERCTSRITDDRRKQTAQRERLS